MLAINVYLKAFDSVHNNTLRDILQLNGIPVKIVGPLIGQYSGLSAVKCGGG